MGLNVITIDFDVIMAPSIDFYNDMISAPGTPLSQLIEGFPSLEYSFPADLFVYSFLTQNLTAWAMKKPKIYVISNHRDMDKILHQQKSSEINLINIDHHHDVNYEADAWNKTIFKAECGNWVKHCKDAKLITKYTWVHNDKFEIDGAKPIGYIDEHYSLHSFAMRNIPDPDVVVLCASQEWIPPHYQPLFTAWVSLCEEITGQTLEFDKF